MGSNPGAVAGLERVVQDFRSPAGLCADLLGPLHDLWDGLEPRRRRHPDPHPGLRPAEQERVGNVVPVTHVGHDQIAQLPLLLLHSQKIGQALAWVFEVGKGVDYRDG